MLLNIIIAVARCKPTNLGKKNVPPLSGTKPILEKACVNFTDAFAIVKSQAKAIFAPAPAATPAATDPAARLGQLKALLDQGLITQADFDSTKAEILKQLLG